MTSASPRGRARSGLVTPKQQSCSRSRSSGEPVNVMAGWIASGTMSLPAADSNTEMPCAPDVCRTSWPGVKVPVALSPAMRSARASSGTASTTRWAPATTSGIGLTGTPGSRVAARSRLSSLTAETALTTWPARARAAPRTAPTRPAPTMPTSKRAGRSPTARYRLQSGGVDPVPWRDAWHEALYAAGCGFYVARGGPAAHFTTAAHGPTGAALARALLALPDHPVRVVVDLGAGRGELATHLLDALEHRGSRYAVAPPHDETPRPSDAIVGSTYAVAAPRDESPRARVVAVDVVDRPDGLDQRVEWLRSPGGAGL